LRFKRLSVSDTVNSSSPTTTYVASTSAELAPELLIPPPQEFLFVLLHNSPHLAHSVSLKFRDVTSRTGFSQNFAVARSRST